MLVLVMRFSILARRPTPSGSLETVSVSGGLRKFCVLVTFDALAP